MTSVEITNRAPLRKSENPACWFDDGNILLQAEDTLFRVYKGILRKASAVFDDMLSFPQPEAGLNPRLGDNLTVGIDERSCPVVEMHETAKDIELFLCAVHNPRYVVMLCYPLVVTKVEFLSQASCLSPAAHRNMLPSSISHINYKPIAFGSASS